MVNKDLKKCIIDIAYNNKMGHIGSSFACIDIIDWIFSKKKQKDDIFILSNGHASLALYAILEKYYGLNANNLFLKHGLHPHLDEDNKIYCTTGSLGQGITVAIGRALGNPNINIHCMVSDGETYEGSFWESLRFINDKNISNIFIYVIANGLSAYDTINTKDLIDKISKFNRGNIAVFSDMNMPIEELNNKHLTGLLAHYHVLNDDEYKNIIALLS